MLAFTDRRPTPPLAAYTERTITDPAALDAELARIRKARLGRSLRGARAGAERDRRAGLVGATATLAGDRRRAGPDPALRPRPSRGKRCRSLLEHAAAISAELGGFSLASR